MVQLPLQESLSGTWLSWLDPAPPESSQATSSMEPQDSFTPSVIKRALGAAPSHGGVLMGMVVLVWGGDLGLLTTHVWPAPSLCLAQHCCDQSDPGGVEGVRPRP